MEYFFFVDEIQLLPKMENDSNKKKKKLEYYWRDYPIQKEGNVMLIIIRD